MLMMWGDIAIEYAFSFSQCLSSWNLKKSLEILLSIIGCQSINMRRFYFEKEYLFDVRNGFKVFELF